ncbi:hypothetical protein [Bradyrhizobium sp. SZCCHNR1020]|uniref:hypothetical protein n=1 Tax=Bradyrhizobium sp. SZCCHNR1020 TaxID=3057343 RepID=UPI002916E320|nr:hypothetical protein [Bradyrhizobium sp. SZCCHNR1020]
MSETGEQAPAVAAMEAGFEWCIVEIFGHRRHVGRGREEERFGAKMLRIDVPTITLAAGDGATSHPPAVQWTTHFYGGASIFSFTLTDEDTVMRMNRPNDYARFRLPAREPEEDLFDHDAIDGDGGEDA